jgi:hypothetical protein
MVNAMASNFIVSFDKTAKNRRYCSTHSLAHTLPKGMSTETDKVEKGLSSNEKGISRNLLFVGFNVYVASSVGTNTISEVRQLETIRATSK